MSARFPNPLEQARFNMVEQQVRPWEVLEQRVLDRLFAVPREQFVPPDLATMAFVDMDLPLRVDGVDSGECMLAPKLEARLAQELRPATTHSILEIGTGSGYQAALLAGLGGSVTSVELRPDLLRFARQNLERAGLLSQVELLQADASRGLPQREFDRVLVTGSLPALPDELLLNLKVGGEMIAIVGTAPIMRVVRVIRTRAGSWDTDSLFDTLVPALKGVAVPQFKF